MTILAVVVVVFVMGAGIAARVEVGGIALVVSHANSGDVTMGAPREFESNVLVLALEVAGVATAANACDDGAAAPCEGECEAVGQRECGLGTICFLLMFDRRRAVERRVAAVG